MQHVGPHDALPDATATERRPVHPLLLAALGILLALTYVWTIRDLGRAWVADDQVVLSLIVVAGAAFILWDRREGIARLRPRPAWWGLLALAGSLALLVVGTRAHFTFYGGRMGLFLRGASLIAWACGAVMLAWGWRALVAVLVPMVMLAFAYPGNFATTSWLAVPLQHFATVVSGWLVSALGTEVVQDGQLLQTVNFVANVEVGCIGIKSLITVLPTALFIGTYGLRRGWARAALVVLAVPLTLLLNVLRIATTVMLGTHVGEKVAGGFFHYSAGLGMFVVCLIGLLGLVKLLDLLEGPAPSDSEQGDELDPAAADLSSVRPGRPTAKAAFAAIGVTLVLGCVYQLVELRGIAVAARSFPDSALDRVPYEIGDWFGADVDAEIDLRDFVHCTSWFLREYGAPGEASIQVLLLYRRPGAGATFEKRQRLSVKPPLVVPSAGSEVERTRLRLGAPGLGGLDLVTRLTVSGDERVLVSSWHLLGGATPEPTPGGILSRVLYGVRESLKGRRMRQPEISCHFVSAVRGEDGEDVSELQQHFAAAFTVEVLAALEAVAPDAGAARHVLGMAPD